MDLAQRETTMHISNTCANCDSKTRCRKREFSEQAWSVLLAWSEVDPDAVDQPVCDDCYVELRDILIDRAAEVEVALSSPAALRAQIAAAKTAKATGTAPAKKPAAKAAPAKTAAAAKSTAKGKTTAAKKKKVSKLAS